MHTQTVSLAWDWVNEKLYWTDFGKDTIEVFDLATGQRMILIHTSQTTQDTIPRGLVVDPVTRYFIPPSIGIYMGVLLVLNTNYFQIFLFWN